LPRERDAFIAALDQKLAIACATGQIFF
jgi:hypothetical protein